ncbi:Ig-like domain-containing protein [Candidatus Bathyarchaeota archaeon]|nr:Ig-like domain-containing protein [Candidatus Bathyarchaeota archaeon]
MWTGYCLDDSNLTITDWWNTPATARSFNVTLKGLTDGSHTLVVYTEDTFGNTGASETVNFAIDITPPVISILSIQNRTYDSATVPLTFAVNESTIQIECSLDGQNNITIIENSTLTRLSNGVHNVTIYAWDEAGNIGASETIYFSVEVPFPTMLVASASGVSVAVIGVGLLVYFKKRKH